METNQNKKKTNRRKITRKHIGAETDMFIYKKTIKSKCNL